MRAVADSTESSVGIGYNAPYFLYVYHLSQTLDAGVRSGYRSVIFI